MIIEYEEGDLVRILSGPQEGSTGQIDSYDDDSDHWLVKINGVLYFHEFTNIFPINEDDEEEIGEEAESPPPFGMSSDQLAQYVERYATRCASRVRGVGDMQYNQGDYQRFETMSPVEILTMLQEELEDLVPYCVMLHIVTQRMAVALRGADIG